jgi:hypothetical protein
MGIKIKNVSRDSFLHKVYVPITLTQLDNTANALTVLSETTVGQGIVPVDATFEKLIMNADTSISATSGYTIQLVDGYGSADIINSTFNAGTNATVANVPFAITATAVRFISGGGHIELLFSGTQGAAKLAATAVFDIEIDV